MKYAILAPIYNKPALGQIVAWWCDSQQSIIWTNAGISFGVRPANERRC